MKLDLFVISDVHGHSSIAEKALQDAGFEINNPKHLLVINGDCFDRGPENRKFFQYLNVISNKILIKGNHEEILENVLLNGKLTSNDLYNGVEHTVTEFFKDDYIPEYRYLYSDSPAYGELTPFLNSARDYFETENYVITHSWLPIDVNEYTGKGSVHHYWRYDCPEAWSKARWTEWYKAYNFGCTLSNKTLVVGHRAARFARAVDSSRASDDDSIYYGKGVIAIDSATKNTQKVNVLVLRDEEVPVPVTHEMSLRPQYFEAVKSGKKTVEMRLFDEKREAIRSGDKITFTSKESGEKLTVTVVGLYGFGNFRQLTQAFLPEDLGFPNSTKEEITQIMNGIYPSEQIDTYGVLAIRISTATNQF